MKKQTKLNLNELKVNSFVTSLESKDAQTVKGGTGVLVTVSEPIRFAVATAVLVSITIAVSVVVDAVDAKKEEGKK